MLKAVLWEGDIILLLLIILLFLLSLLLLQGNITLPDTSAWAEVSEDYWWARGRLAGGGMLSITFTPPECGCLTLRYVTLLVHLYLHLLPRLSFYLSLLSLSLSLIPLLSLSLFQHLLRPACGEPDAGGGSSSLPR